MPKKSDRKEHESAMSSLLPEVSLDEQAEEKEEVQKGSSTEDKNGSDVEEQNYSSTTSSTEASVAKDEKGGEGSQELMDLEVLPHTRPNLDRKLGPYVSEDVDDALEDVYLLLRRQLGGGASKSLIVEAALRFVLVDYLRRKESSELGRWLQQVLESEEQS